MRRRHVFAFVLLIAAGLGLGRVVALGKDAVELRGATDSIGACAVVPAALSVARHYDVPIGIEEAPDGCWGKPLESTAEDWSAHAKPSEIENALDGLVAAAPAYAWREMGGVVVIRPRSAWSSSSHILRRPVGAFDATFSDLASALNALSQSLPPRRFQSWIDSASLAPPGTTGIRTNLFPPLRRPDRAPYSVRFDGGTLLDAMNAMVRRHDRAGWLLSYCATPATEETATLRVAVHEEPAGRGKFIVLAGPDGHANPCLGRTAD